MRAVFHSVKNFFGCYFLPILSGIFIGTSYIPFPPWAALFCFVPLWVFWKRQTSLKTVLLGGWITQFVFTLIGFNWVAHTAEVFGQMPKPLAIIVLLLFSSLSYLYVPIAGGVWFLLKKRNPLKSFVGMALFIAFFEPVFPSVFPWNFGYTWLWSKLPLYHLADTVGFQGLSAITILANLPFCWMVESWPSVRKMVPPVLFSLSFFILLNAAGYFRKNSIELPNEQIDVLLVQANIGNQEQVFKERGSGYQSYIVDKFVRLTQDALSVNTKDPRSSVRTLIWPETAYPLYLGKGFMESHVAKGLVSFLREEKINLITGAYSRHPKTKKITNSMIFLNDFGEPIGDPYHKTILLAFGEYIPGADLFPKLKDLIPAGDFERGGGPQVNDFAGVKFGPQICYESLFPDFSRALADKGAEIIVNITNDSWYNIHQEPYQHLYMTLGRAIEFRRPLIRSTNTGISTVILADGQILESSGTRSVWTHQYSVPYVKDPEPTFYQRFPWLVCSLLAFGILGFLRPWTIFIKPASSN